MAQRPSVSRIALGVGLRHRSMRTPNQLQQNFAVECMINEAAAAAGSDPNPETGIDHTTDQLA